jgi:beta-lactamase regulating signal transducer with metallopeptidase domain
MMAMELQPLAQVFAGRLVNTLFDGVAITLVLWMVLRLTGRQNSGTRFALWLSALAGIAALPLLSGASGMTVGVRPVTEKAELYLPVTWAIGLFYVWAAGAGTLLAGLGIGLWRLHQFRAGCSEVDPATFGPDITKRLKEGANRRVKLCVSEAIAVPSVMGFFRPAIIFPAWLLPNLSAEDVNTVLLHELAHLRRWDDWSNLFQKVVKALFFFHPAVWWIESRLTLEREMACDDLVLAQSASPRVYAASLLSLAEKIQQRRGLALVQALLGRAAQISQRIAQILDIDRPKGVAAWKPALGIGGAVIAIALVGFPYAPRLVAFGSSSSPALNAHTVLDNTSARLATEGPESGSVQAQYVSFRPKVNTGNSVPSKARTKMLSNRNSRKETLARTRHNQQLEPNSGLVPAVFQAQRRFHVQQTVIILQSPYAARVPQIWLCIWTVNEGNPGDRQLESGIILDSI